MDLDNIKQSKKFTELISEMQRPTSACYLFTSNDVSLVNNFAFYFASGILCEKHNFCKSCDNCKRILLSKHPDLLEYKKDMLTVADAKEIIEKSLVKPLFEKYKIFLIDNAETLNELAQNKLLKSFEEPNESTIFILTSSMQHKILPTIASRCKKINLITKDCYDISSLESNDICNNQNLSLTEIENLKSEKFLSTFNKVCEMINNLNHSSNIPKIVNELNVKTLDKNMFIRITYQLYKDMLYRQLGLTNLCVYKKNFQKNYSIQALLEICNIINVSYQQIQHNVFIGYVIDNLLLEILKARFKWN